MTPSASVGSDRNDDIAYPSATGFVLVHLSCAAVLWTGATIPAVAIGVALYLIRMFAICAGYHRYFAHRSFRTGRVFQFLLAFLAQSSAQRGVLWWAAHHRRHHKYADTDDDVHSPVTSGVLHAHVGWIFIPRNTVTNLDAVRDFSGYPELRWLDRHPYFPPTLVGVLAWLLGGWPMLVAGFCWSTVAVWHATFSINSLAHVAGRRRYVTGDQSRNNWFLALLTLGEGWHNNHHACQTSARQGFRWWEYDVTFYVLKVLSWCGIVWDLHLPPSALLRGEQRPGRRVIERAAAQLAASLPINTIAGQVFTSLTQKPGWIDMRARILSAGLQAEQFWSQSDVSWLPTLEDVRRHARARLAHSPSFDEIAVRARQRLLELVYERVMIRTAAEPAQ